MKKKEKKEDGKEDVDYEKVWTKKREKKGEKGGIRENTMRWKGGRSKELEKGQKKGNGEKKRSPPLSLSLSISVSISLVNYRLRATGKESVTPVWVSASPLTTTPPTHRCHPRRECFLCSLTFPWGFLRIYCIIISFFFNISPAVWKCIIISVSLIFLLMS